MVVHVNSNNADNMVLREPRKSKQKGEVGDGEKVTKELKKVEVQVFTFFMWLHTRNDIA